MPTSVHRLPTAAATQQLDSAEFAALLDQLSAEFAAGAEQHDRDASFPHRNFERLHELGLLALTVPRAHGGLGATLAQTARVIAAVARGEASTALVLTMQYLHHASAKHAAKWPQHLLHRVIEDTLRDGALINALRVEPELGTPARGGLPATTARRTPEGWRISGRKIYSTGIPRLTWLAVWARSDDAEPLVGSWLVHRDTPGISVIESWDHLGMRATGSHDVVFDDVLVPLDHAVEVAPANSAPDLDPALLLDVGVAVVPLRRGGPFGARLAGRLAGPPRAGESGRALIQSAALSGGAGPARCVAVLQPRADRRRRRGPRGRRRCLPRQRSEE